MLAEEWAASLGSRPASAAAVFGGSVADPHNRTPTACQPRVQPGSPESLHSLLCSFLSWGITRLCPHSMTCPFLVFLTTLTLHGTDGRWRRCGRFQDKNCLVTGLGTAHSLFLFGWNGISRGFPREAEPRGRNGALLPESWDQLVTHHGLQEQITDLGGDLTSSLAELSASSCWAAPLTSTVTACHPEALESRHGKH